MNSQRPRSVELPAKCLLENTSQASAGVVEGRGLLGCAEGAFRLRERHWKRKRGFSDVHSSGGARFLHGVKLVGAGRLDVDRRWIERLARPSTKPPYLTAPCSNITQVTVNNWHYSSINVHLPFPQHSSRKSTTVPPCTTPKGRPMLSCCHLPVFASSQDILLHITAFSPC